VLFSVFTGEQDILATCSMPCKQLSPLQCTCSGANRQARLKIGWVSDFGAAFYPCGDGALKWAVMAGQAGCATRFDLKNDTL
jgi:hypothetical protein